MKFLGFETNLFDFMKSIFLVIIIGFMFFNYGRFTSWLDRPTTGINEDTITMIAENIAKAQFTASDAKIKELKKELRNNESKLLAVIKENNEKVDEIGIIRAELEQSRDLNRRSDHVYLKGKKTDHHFIKIYKTDTEGKKFLWAWAMFHPNQDPGKLWKVGTYPIEFHTNIVETENKDGVYNRYVEMNIQNNQMKETKGIKFPIEITSVQWAKSEYNERSFMWNPRLGFVSLLTNDDAFPGLDLSLFSYGKTKRDMDWRFLSLGFGGNNEDIYGLLKPFEYNVGNFVPLIENMFIGPAIVFDMQGEKSYGGGISIPF